MSDNIKAIRTRLKSVESTVHITRAMELVASSKIRRASAKMEQSRFYRDVMLGAFTALASEKMSYSTGKERELPTLYIIIAGDRGLAGGYNSNIFRSSVAMLRENDPVIPIGKRTVDYFSRHTNVLTAEFVSCENLSSEDCAKIAYLVRDMYDRNEIGAVNLISTKFVSMLSQIPDITYLLPLEMIGRKNDSFKSEKLENVFQTRTEFEPSVEEVIAAVVPEYISGVIYSAAAESFASEVAARRSAMDAASNNAQTMHDELSLRYNRARQNAITQEIAEIASGANA